MSDGANPLRAPDGPPALIPTMCPAALDQRLTNGASLVELLVPISNYPWVEQAGMFKGIPIFDEVIAKMERQRY